MSPWERDFPEKALWEGGEGTGGRPRRDPGRPVSTPAQPWEGLARRQTSTVGTWAPPLAGSCSRNFFFFSSPIPRFPVVCFPFALHVALHARVHATTRDDRCRGGGPLPLGLPGCVSLLFFLRDLLPGWFCGHIIPGHRLPARHVFARGFRHGLTIGKFRGPQFHLSVFTLSEMEECVFCHMPGDIPRLPVCGKRDQPLAPS